MAHKPITPTLIYRMPRAVLGSTRNQSMADRAYKVMRFPLQSRRDNDDSGSGKQKKQRKWKWKYLACAHTLWSVFYLEDGSRCFGPDPAMDTIPHSITLSVWAVPGWTFPEWTFRTGDIAAKLIPRLPAWLLLCQTDANVEKYPGVHYWPPEEINETQFSECFSFLYDDLAMEFAKAFRQAPSTTLHLRAQPSRYFRFGLCLEYEV